MPEPTEEELGLQHSLFYASNTNELKDDIAQLISCLKTGSGIFKRHEAGLLLWHHALQDDKREDLLAAGLVQACLPLLLDTADVSQVEKRCAVGLLHEISKCEAGREVLAKGKCGSASCLKVLLGMVAGDVAGLRQHSSGILRNMATNAASHAPLMKAVDGQLEWGALLAVLAHEDSSTVLDNLLSSFAILQTHPELLAAVLEEKQLLPVLLGILRRCKAELPVASAAQCLKVLVQLAPEQVAPRLIGEGGITTLVDLLGAPPAGIIKYEQQRAAAAAAALASPFSGPGHTTASFTGSSAPDHAGRQASSSSSAHRQAVLQLGTPATVSRQQLNQLFESGHTEEGISALKLSGAAAGRLDRASSRSALSPGNSVLMQQLLPQRKAGFSPKLVPDSSLDLGAARRARSPPHQSLAQAQQQQQQQAQQGEGGERLSLCSVVMKWSAPMSLKMCSAAAACCCKLAQQEEVAEMLSRRLAAARLALVICKVMAQAEAGAKGKKAGKKKRKGGPPPLAPEQEELLAQAAGCLKFLTAASCCDAARVALAGAAGPLVVLLDSPRLTLRRNARDVLCNMSMVAQLEPLMTKACLPAELVAQVPLKLARPEIEQLLREYPEQLEELLPGTTAALAAEAEAALASARAPAPANIVPTPAVTHAATLRQPTGFGRDRGASIAVSSAAAAGSSLAASTPAAPATPGAAGGAGGADSGAGASEGGEQGHSGRESPTRAYLWQKASKAYGGEGAGGDAGLEGAAAGGGAAAGSGGGHSTVAEAADREGAGAAVEQGQAQ